MVDANVSHFIICFVLYNLGTQEIRGFAIALAVGVLATLFSALVISRFVFRILVDAGHWTKASMLPTVVPALQRALEPHVNWLRLRPVFLTMSIAWVIISLLVARTVGPNMLDTEFRGGTQVTLQLGLDNNGKQRTMTPPRRGPHSRSSSPTAATCSATCSRRAKCSRSTLSLTA